MNTTHVQHDALAAVRAELTMAAGRRIRRRRARRRTAVIVALIALLLAATAATAALIKNSTGVPAVDKLLEIEVPPSQRPGPGSASKPLTMPEGDHNTNVVAYLARNGSVCVSSADFGRGGGVRGGYGGCPPLEYVNRRVERRGAAWFGASHGLDARTYQLIVGGDVESIRALAKGDWRFRITPPWTPHARDARPLGLVIAIDEQDLPEQDLARLQVRFPKLELRYPNGKTRVARFP